MRLPEGTRSEEHTSELQSRRDLVCRLLLEKKKRKTKTEIDQKHDCDPGASWDTLHSRRYSTTPRSVVLLSLRRFMFHFFLECYVAHRDLHSFPTRRSSDLVFPFGGGGNCWRVGHLIRSQN